MGGDIEALGLDSDAVLICNEEGKLMGLSGLVCAVFTGAGAALFRRKDLK